MKEAGYVQVYTGNGKGKTTAALGLALRALGAGLRVFFGQFVKGMRYSELELLERLDGIEVEQFGLECFIRGEPSAQDVEAAREGLRRCAAVLARGAHDLVVLDEANIAVHFGLFTVEELLQAVEARAKGVEVVITGRYAHPKLLEAADLVTEMKEVKHYYTRGVQARTGIEK